MDATTTRPPEQQHLPADGMAPPGMKLKRNASRAEKQAYQREWRRRNPDKARAYKKNWQTKNPSVYRAGAVRIAKRRRDKRKALIDEIKSKPCMDCGGVFPPCCMDFDHRDRATKVEVVSRIGFPGGFDARLQEIEKCDLVCANCHRIRTFTGNQHKRRPNNKGESL